MNSSVEGRFRIAGAVVLYNPKRDVVGNIVSYLRDLDILYAVDNSERPDRETVGHILQLNEKVVYLSKGENLGVATALNTAAREAIKGNCHFLLTMDQDSRAAEGMIGNMLECLEGRDLDRVAIVSPFHSLFAGSGGDDAPSCQEVPFVMTSGNLLNLSAYLQVGPYLDKLFIDCIDYDYCLRILGCGLTIVRANRAVLHHALGDIKSFKILHKTITTSNHSPLRRYYNTRNRFYIWETYGSVAQDFVREDRRKFFGEIRNVLLGEKDKLGKMKMMIRGYLDYRRGRFGKYGE